MAYSEFLSKVKSVVGDNYVLVDGEETKPYYKEYRGRFIGTGLAVVRPANTLEVSAVIKLCAEYKIPVVPQGGNTSLVGGSIPYQDNTIVLSLSRLNKIHAVDVDNFTITVDAGCILANVQNAASEVNRFFPLSLGAEGSCQIGGNIASNAGGILTIGYGNTRDLVLGLEVVMPDGEIWNGLRGLRKDNTGYDLKHLFIGSEGTLGIITAAVLKLFPVTKTQTTFFVAVDNPSDALELLSRTRGELNGVITAFELIARPCIELAQQYGPQCVDPLSEKTAWTVLAEVNVATEQVEEFLGTMLEAGTIKDATIAMNEQQRQDLWFMREAIVEAQRNAGASIKHDISVAVSNIPAFVEEATALVHRLLPGVRPIIFGHMGDGNLHFNLTQPIDADKENYLAQWDHVNHAVHDVIQKYNGSFSAEHGVGVFKAEELAARKSSVELRMMHAIKNSLDPHHIMNPGKVLLDE